MSRLINLHVCPLDKQQNMLETHLKKVKSFTLLITNCLLLSKHAMLEQRPSYVAVMTSALVERCQINLMSVELY